MFPSLIQPAFRPARGRVIVWAIYFTLLGFAGFVPDASAQCPAVSGFGGLAGYGANVLARNDDASSPTVDITPVFGPAGIDFFGNTYTSLHVNTNGNVSFDGAIATYTPFAFPGARIMIAPFFADVDTRTSRGAANQNNRVYWHLDTTSSPRRLIVTWFDVDYYAMSRAPGSNTFQMIMFDRSDRGAGDFDVEFRYASVNWTTGDLSGGSGGLGGTRARIGFDAGDGVNYFTHPVSGTPPVVDIDVHPSNHPSDCVNGSFLYLVINSCGDGVVDAAEQCDDGNTTGGDGCSSICTPEPGYVCPPPATACFATCGNGEIDAGETCDDGNSASADGCTGTCILELGWTCPIVGAPCDEVCGDGRVVGAEQCDDGNTAAGDGCDATCLIEIPDPCPSASTSAVGNAIATGNTCSNGEFDAAASCGGTNSGGDYAVAYTASATGTYVFDTINGATTFDTVLYARRTCGGTELACNDDTGFLESGSQITLSLAAGETVIVYVSGFGTDCGTFRLDVSATITPPVCGDGVRAVSEACDDGNRSAGDGCSGTCVIEPGWLCPTPGARCDEICGDGRVVGREECDDGNTTAGDGCSAVCTLEVVADVCGDGTVGATEECDDGNTTAGDGCSADCTLEVVADVCGDGTVGASEECDDGNTIAGDGCSPTCTIEVVSDSCGDGAVDAGESCDDGNADDGDGCGADCQVEDGWSCDHVGAGPSFCDPECGDGLILGDEECDDANVADGDGCAFDCLVEDGFDCVDEPSECAPEGTDTDGDGVADVDDNCPDVPNADQLDTDGDGVGDACDDGVAGSDSDGDGVDDADDNCPDVPNPDQLDADGDGVGDACETADADRDGDGVPDASDNCPDVPNARQTDTDGDGVGDLCDEDQLDTDRDGIADADDNCPDDINPLQNDADGDGVGDACEDDDRSPPTTEDSPWVISGGGPSCAASGRASGTWLLTLGLAVTVLRRRRS